MTDEVDFEFSIPEEVITQRAQALNEVDEFPFVDPEEYLLMIQRLWIFLMKRRKKVLLTVNSESLKRVD